MINFIIQTNKHRKFQPTTIFLPKMKNKMNSKIKLILLLAIILSGCEAIKLVKEKPSVEQIITEFQTSFEKNDFKFAKYPEVIIDSIRIDSVSQSINIFFNDALSYIPIREKYVKETYAEIKGFFRENDYNGNLTIYSLNYPIEELIPNFYRSDSSNYDVSRLFLNNKSNKQIVKRINSGFKPEKGLLGKNIALWHSHGWYYNQTLDRWMWQRARLFETVEDLGPLAFTIPYLIPMLENAGANVFVPRERDIQTHEVIVDNDKPFEFYSEIAIDGNWETAKTNGFLYTPPPYPGGYNPFLYGTHRTIKSNTKTTAWAEFIPEIPETGNYAVYITYVSGPNNVTDAHFTVFHSGGSTEFTIDQTIGGKIWIYLGTFKFNKGYNPKTGKVVLTNKSSVKGKIVSADAVRFGGGMGVIERGGRTGERPKFTEGARYYLQYLGMPDTLVYNLNNNENDYKDDYQSRGEYVNYLVGKPFGPNKDRTVEGLGIPIDISLAFHTDAGISKSDTVIGTLSIYSIEDIDSVKEFPNGVSRLANRDLADILQTQLVEDIRAKYDPVWKRRRLWNAMYSEAARPNVPAVLLELLSHQNFLDVKFMLDPTFRFDVARAIYKAFLKFLATEYNYDYVVQPLPPDHFSIEFGENNTIKLSWKPVLDPLEPTAAPTQYKVYVRKNDNGFNNGIIVDTNYFEFKLPTKDDIYGFKITAINSGGESFPTEILSACKVSKSKGKILIVNGFDRISAPAFVETDKFTGFLDVLDAGVPDKFDLGYTGMQHNFDPNSPWKTDDIPGHGASYANYETKIIAGNSFDFPYIHGSSIKQAGYSFVSCSDESITDSLIDLKKYKIVDFIFGEEKETNWQKPYADSLWGTRFKIFTKAMQNRIMEFLKSGGNAFFSGAYLGSDIFLNKNSDFGDINFAQNVLHYKLDSDHAVRTGNVYSIDETILPENFEFEFNTELNDTIYAVEAPDAIGPVKESKTFLRYKENRYSAGVYFEGDYKVVITGFPFETIKSEAKRNNFMQAILDFLN